MGKSAFEAVTSAELANQIAAKKKSIKKLPTWFKTPLIYFPALISIEQCSSEVTARYKSALVKGDSLVDVTGGFGVDSYYFSNQVAGVTHCEINEELSEIAQHNASILSKTNIEFIKGDGMVFVEKATIQYGTIYIDPSRRSDKGKVFMLKDCVPNVVENLDYLISKSERILIKTSPLLDITAGLKELKNVSEIHIVSTKNECKELIFVVDRLLTAPVKIVCSTLNESLKQFSFEKGGELVAPAMVTEDLESYLYEPDAALLKSGAFDLVAVKFDLKKLHRQTQLYTSNNIEITFPGRIFKIDKVSSTGDLKKEKNLIGNVIVRSFPEKAEVLVKKHKIKPDQNRFLIFTQYREERYIVVSATIIQHY
jgi:hypothetical protein